MKLTNEIFNKLINELIKCKNEKEFQEITNKLKEFGCDNMQIRLAYKNKMNNIISGNVEDLL